MDNVLLKRQHSTHRFSCSFFFER